MIYESYVYQLVEWKPAKLTIFLSVWCTTIGTYNSHENRREYLSTIGGSQEDDNVNIASASSHMLADLCLN